jgi:Zn-finger nucleic acid-binding protein
MSTQPSHCPRCPEVSLRSLRTQHGTMGFCTRCQGHWVTQQAGDFLAPLLTNLAQRLTGNVNNGHCAQGLHTLAPGQERCEVCPQPSLRCPACASRMLPFETHGQTVDVCTRCPGVWLDANELAALRSAQARPLSARLPVQGLSVERSKAPGASLGEATANAAAEGALAWLLGALLGL